MLNADVDVVLTYCGPPLIISAVAVIVCAVFVLQVGYGCPSLESVFDCQNFWYGNTVTPCISGSANITITNTNSYTFYILVTPAAASAGVTDGTFRLAWSFVAGGELVPPSGSPSVSASPSASASAQSLSSSPSVSASPSASASQSGSASTTATLTQSSSSTRSVSATTTPSPTGTGSTIPDTTYVYAFSTTSVLSSPPSPDRNLTAASLATQVTSVTTQLCASFLVTYAAVLQCSPACRIADVVCTLLDGEGRVLFPDGRSASLAAALNVSTSVRINMNVVVDFGAGATLPGAGARRLAAALLEGETGAAARALVASPPQQQPHAAEFLLLVAGILAADHVNGSDAYTANIQSTFAAATGLELGATAQPDLVIVAAPGDPQWVRQFVSPSPTPGPGGGSSSNRALALGLGLGLGVPIALLAAGVAVYAVARGRRAGGHGAGGKGVLSGGSTPAAPSGGAGGGGASGGAPTPTHAGVDDGVSLNKGGNPLFSPAGAAAPAATAPGASV